jgi:hypothetical protein
MPFHIDKFRGSPEVQAMHPAGRLGYLYLLASSWQTDDCTVSADPFDLATESGLGDELWALYGPRILRKFSAVEAERLRNQVLFVEWSETKRVWEEKQMTPEQKSDLAKKRRDAGIVGNERRWSLHRKAKQVETKASQNSAPSDGEDGKRIANDRLTGTETIKEPTLSPAPSENVEDVGPIVAQIVVAHPRSRLRNWGLDDVPYSDQVATLQAVDAEAKRGGIPRCEAAVLILGWVEAITKAVPAAEWKFIKPVPDFMRLREYRIDPKQFTRNGEGSGSSKNNQPARVSPAIQRQRDSDQALRNIAERRFGVSIADEANQGPLHQPGAPRSDARDVPGGVGGDGHAVWPGGVSGCVVDGNTGKQVFPAA